MISNKQGFLMLSNDFAECKISVFGANVVSYRPLTENKDVFWLGELNKFDGVGAIRGGIPICWPRFAEEELNSNLPRHGFARLSNWVVKDFFEDETSVGVKLSLIPDAKYGVGIRADYTVRITDKLECVLETFNDGPDDFCFSEALHAYFYVGSRDEAIIKGMVGNTYKNALDRKYYKLEKDWFLPSLKELNTIYTNKSTINTAITNAGCTTISSNLHWSSTEYSSSVAWILYMNNGSVDGYDKRNSTNYVRCAVAF